MQQKKWLLKIFFLSLGLNLCLFSLLFFFSVGEHIFFSHLSFSFKPTHTITSLPETHPAILAYRKLSFPQLVELLQDEKEVVVGIAIRDVALALLVEDHHFAIFHALPHKYKQIEKKTRQPFVITFYENMGKEDFKQLYSYAKYERYPYTNKGLFFHLQESYEPLLAETFMRTETFHIVKALFPSLDNDLLLQLVLAGEWNWIEELYEKEKKEVSFSSERRVQFLENYLLRKVNIAAYLLLLGDYDFILEKFDDSKLLLVLELLSKKSPGAIKFAKALITKGHSDEVIEAAYTKLEEFGELAGRFVERPSIGELRPVFREQPPKSPSANSYIVQSGDSLWLIAKKYNVSIESLKQLNHLQSDLVRPGQSLKLP